VFTPRGAALFLYRQQIIFCQNWVTQHEMGKRAVRCLCVCVCYDCRLEELCKQSPEWMASALTFTQPLSTAEPPSWEISHHYSSLLEPFIKSDTRLIKPTDWITPGLFSWRCTSRPGWGWRDDGGLWRRGWGAELILSYICRHEHVK